MGCFGTKKYPGNKNNTSDIQPQIIYIKKLYDEREQTSSKRLLKRSYFYMIQRKLWVSILNFLKYPDLNQAGRVNKFFNNVAKSQFVLKKFYKNKRLTSHSSIRNNPILQSTFINNNQNITNHFKYTTINTYNSTFNDFYTKEKSVNPTSETKNSIQLYVNNINTDNCEVNQLENKINCDLNKLSFHLPTFHDNHSNNSIQSQASFVITTGRNRNIDKFLKPNSNLINNTKNTIAPGLLHSPYKDLYTNKEIILSNEKNESIEFINLISNRSKLSIGDFSELTPSFSQDPSDDRWEIISITNITQINIPINSVSNQQHHILKHSLNKLNHVKYLNLELRPNTGRNLIDLQNRRSFHNSSKKITTPVTMSRFNSVGSNRKKSGSLPLIYSLTNNVMVIPN